MRVCEQKCAVGGYIRYVGLIIRNIAQRLQHLAGCMDIELWFSRRCIRFLKMAMKSDNVVVRTIINMSIGGFHSVMGINIRLMQSRFKMEERNVLKVLNHKSDNESDAVRLSVHVRELCGWRNICVTVHFLTR